MSDREHSSKKKRVVHHKEEKEDVTTIKFHDREKIIDVVPDTQTDRSEAIKKLEEHPEIATSKIGLEPEPVFPLEPEPVFEGTYEPAPVKSQSHTHTQVHARKFKQIKPRSRINSRINTRII